MIKKIILIVFCCFLGISEAFAYEYRKLNALFNTINTDYVETVNFRNISLNSLKVLSKYDRNLKIYNSDSKAYLYQSNNLIGIFELPSNDENLSSWRDFLLAVLDMSAHRSDKILQNEEKIETSLFALITDNLDTFSRIEKPQTDNKYFRYAFEDGILYIRPMIFKNGTADYINKIILSHPEIKGVVLDLKENMGGSLKEAIDTADLFLDNGIITYSEDKFKNIKYYTATEGDVLNGKPIVILTNGKTASAAEIIVAAFSEQSRAVIVGTKTYGKGSIQNIYKMDNDTLFLTSGHFYSPSGKSINNVGLTPQVCTGFNNSCVIADKSNPDKELLTAIDLINDHLG